MGLEILKELNSFDSWNASRATNRCWSNQQCNENLNFPGPPHSFQGLFQTYPYLISLSRLFKAWKISTLNSTTFQTIPGSVRTLLLVNILNSRRLTFLIAIADSENGRHVTITATNPVWTTNMSATGKDTFIETTKYRSTFHSNTTNTEDIAKQQLLTASQNTSQQMNNNNNTNYTVSQKKFTLFHPFYFCDYLVKCLSILIIYGTTAAEKSCKQMTYSFLIISSSCMNITQQKNKKYILYVFIATHSSYRHASFLQLFQKFVQSLQSATFIWKFLNKFFSG